MRGCSAKRVLGGKGGILPVWLFIEPKLIEKAGLGPANGMLRVEQVVADLGGWNCRTIEAG